MTKGVDPKRFVYVEVIYPQIRFVLPNPFMTAIIKAGTGYLVSPFFGELPEQQVSIRTFDARLGREESAGAGSYRGSIAEAAAWIIANDAKAKEIIEKWLKLSSEIMANSDPKAGRVAQCS